LKAAATYSCITHKKQLLRVIAAASQSKCYCPSACHPLLCCITSKCHALLSHIKSNYHTHAGALQEPQIATPRRYISMETYARAYCCNTQEMRRCHVIKTIATCCCVTLKANATGCCNTYSICYGAIQPRHLPYSPLHYIERQCCTLLYCIALKAITTRCCILHYKQILRVDAYIIKSKCYALLQLKQNATAPHSLGKLQHVVALC
jgi:hypothetical protein